MKSEIVPGREREREREQKKKERARKKRKNKNEKKKKKSFSPWNYFCVSLVKLQKRMKEREIGGKNK